MSQHEDSFHDDVRLVLVFSLITRMMLKNVQASRIGRTKYPELMKAAFGWFNQMYMKERVFINALPALKEFSESTIHTKIDFESELICNITEMASYMLEHGKDRNLGEVVSSITSESFLKEKLRKAWDASTREHMLSFEDWYNQTYTHETIQ